MLDIESFREKLQDLILKFEKDKSHYLESPRVYRRLYYLRG
jgi:hypothetical protein